MEAGRAKLLLRELLEGLQGCHLDLGAQEVLGQHSCDRVKHFFLDLLLLQIVDDRMVRCFAHESLHLGKLAQLVLEARVLFLRVPCDNFL